MQYYLHYLFNNIEKIDEFLASPGVYEKCNNRIQGCNRCHAQTIASAGTFVVCDECTEGLYLLRNYTYSADHPLAFRSKYPSIFASCVPDCKKAHSSFVNDFVTGTCQWCGEYCASCNLKNGCESCQGEIAGRPWVTTTDYSSELTTIQTPSYGSISPPTFKECRRCDDYKTCKQCSTTNAAQCITCWSSDFSLSGGTCNFIGRPTKHYYNYENDNIATNLYSGYDGHCSTYGGNVNCQYCDDHYYLSKPESGYWYDEPFCSNACEATCSGCWCKCSNSPVYYYTCSNSGVDQHCLRIKRDNPNFCYACEAYYGLRTIDSSNVVCDACLSSDPLKQYYFEQIQCSSWLACKDGYDSSGKCTSSCPPGYFGQAIFYTPSTFITYDSTFMKEAKSTYCSACGLLYNCYECMGDGINECTSCKKDYYLNKVSGAVSYGTCEKKEPRGTFIYTLYVNPENLWSSNPKDVQTRTGESGNNNEFNQLQDAIKKAYEMAAPFNKAEITIILKSGGVHAMVRRAEDIESFYLPERWDDWSQHLKLIIKGDGVVTVRYKLRDHFKFLVGAGITIQDVIFQAADSINTPNTAAQKTCLSTSSSDCCLVTPTDPTSDISLASPSFPTGTPASTAKCFFPREPNEQCYFPQGASFFKFDLNANSYSGLSRTQLEDAPTLTLTNVQFLNFLYEFNSFIELNEQGGNIVMTGVTFKNFNTCGAIVRNKRKNLKRTSNGFTETASETYWSPANSYVDSYTDRSRNQAYEMMESLYSETDPSSDFLKCQILLTKCFSISMYNTKFYNFGQLKAPISSPILVDDQMKLQYSGSVLDLEDFKGDVLISQCQFESNIVSYSNCDAVSSLDADLSGVIFGAASADTFTDNYPDFKSSPSAKKNRMQIRSVISIVKHMYKIEISDSTFLKNSGTKGIIYIDKASTITTNPIIIFNNQFTQNVGYLDASVVYIRQRQTNPSGHIDLITPDNTNIYCTGQHFQSNTYTNNFACPRWGGAVVKIDCQDTTDNAPIYQRNDRITTTSLSPLKATDWSNVITTSYDTTKQATYTPISASTAPTAFTYDDKATQFVKEVYSGNYASGGKGIIDIYGVPRVFLNDIQFLNNGDSIKEVVSTYGTGGTYPPIKGLSGSEMTVGNAISSSQSATKLCQAMIKIEKCLQLKILAATFDANWLLENAYDSSRAQLVTLNQFYGEFLLDQLVVQNQMGMVGINTVLGSLSSLGVPSTSMYQTASFHPLFKWKSTDKMKFKPWLQTGNSKFLNIYYSQTPSSSTSDRLFWPQLGSYYTSTSILIFKNVDFDNIQCYQCVNQPIYATVPSITFDTVTFTNVNSISYSASNSACSSTNNCKQTNSFFQFQINNPTSSSAGDQIQITKMQVNNYWGGCEGRLFYFDSSSSSTNDANGPLRESVIITYSSFQKIYHECDGGFAKVNLRKMTMRIQGVHATDLVSFKTIHSRYSSNVYGNSGSVGFGGVMLIDSLYKISLIDIVAEDFRMRQNTLTNGGGRFLYFKEAFTPLASTAKNMLVITNSQFRCESSLTPFSSGSTIQTNLQSSYVDQGSAFHIQATYNAIDVNIQTSKIEYCSSAFQGAALYASTPLTKTLNLLNNRFANNIALNGGAIYCDSCEWQTLQQNEFQSNYAMIGGDIYMKKPTVYPVKFISHRHLGSYAYQEGAGMYIEDSSSATPTIQIYKTSTFVSQYNNNRCDVSGCSGGAMSIRVVNPIVVSVTDTTFLSNYAGSLGASLFIASSLKSTATVTLTSCSFTSNNAKTSASVIYIPNSATTATVTVVDTAFSLNQATDSDGGLFYSAATTSNLIKFQNTGTGPYIIQDSFAGNNGGIFYMSGNQNTLTIDEKTKILTSKATQNGGVVYIQGNDATQTNYFNLNGGYIESSTSQFGSGGVAYMTGLAKHIFNGVITNTVKPVIKTITSGSHGGVLYMNGLKHEAWTNQLEVSSAYSAGEGGFLYSTTNTQNLKADIQKSSFIGVYAATQGSIISLRRGSSDPTLTLSVYSQSVVQCLNTYSAANIANIQSTLLSTANPPVPSTIGGAFFFDTVAVGSTVTSSSSTYQNCYTAISGAVFYLPPNTVFTDTGSTFQQNAAFKGAIYCQSCDAKFSGSIFKNNIAYDGSIIYMLNDAKAWFTSQSVMQNGLAYRYGGAIYAGGTGVYPTVGTQTRPKIIVENCISGVLPSNPITGFEAKSSGGFIYTDHPKMIIEIASCAFNNIIASNTGGFIEGAQFTSFSLINCLDGLKNIKAGTSGSFINSINPNILFTLQSCSITCEDPYTAPTTVAPVNRGSLIELKYADSVTSTNNRFDYCYTASMGSVFKLSQIRISVTDTGSYFTNNAGEMGGAIYLEESSATFTGTKFDNNWGKKGGTFYLTKQQVLTLEDITVSSSSATQLGGFIFAEEPLGTQTVTINIKRTASYSVGAVDFANIKSGLEGGVFYLNNNRVTLNINGYSTTSLFRFQNVKSSTDGGLVYSNSQLGIYLKKVKIEQATAESNGGIMYIAKAQEVLLEDTTITTTQATNGKGGILYLANTASNPLNQVTFTRVAASDVYSTLSGSMIYSEATTPSIALSTSSFQCKTSNYASVSMGLASIGGAFFIKGAVAVTSSSNTIQYCYNSDTGGAFHIENSKLTDTSSIIRDNTAVYGGAISCKSCTLLSLTSTQLYHHSAYTTALNVGGLGGVIYLDQPTVVTLDQIKVIEGLSMNKGGFVYAEGSAASPTATFTIQNTINTTPMTLEQFQSDLNGGGFYVNHPKLSISMVSPVALKNSKALGGSGGVFYFNQVSAVNLGQSTFEDVFSTQSGSFLYSIANGLQLTVSTSSVNCASTSQLSTSTSIDLSSDLGIVVPTYSRGGAFYIKDATIATQVTSLSLFNCHTGDTGGAFSLINTVLTDQTSRYYHNGAIKGGAVYCDNCWMELNDVKYYWSQAYYGGTFYIKTLQNTGSTIPMQVNAHIYDSKAFKNGGSFYIDNLASASSKMLDISDMTIERTSSVVDGGMMYLDNILQSVTVNNVQVTDSSSTTGSGGVFYVKNSATLTISESVATKSYFKTVKAPLKGSFLFSESTSMILSLSNTDVECQTTSLSATPAFFNTWDGVATAFTDRGGAFYIQNAGTIIQSSSNIFQRCYAASQGGIFSLIRSKLVDTSSVYNQNAAIKGGVFYLEDSKLDITSATITNSYAGLGGVFYKYGNGNLDIKSSVMTTSWAKQRGGIGYFLEKSGFNPATEMYTVWLTSPLAQLTTITGAKSDNEGGSFYVDSKQIQSFTIDNGIIQNSLSTTEKGGVFYISKIAGLLFLTSSVFKDFSSIQQGSFLYSQSDTQFGLVSTSSTFDCSVTLYDASPESSLVLTSTSGSRGGAFYIKDSIYGIESTFSAYRNCYTAFEGGAFFLTNTKMVDTQSKFMLNAAQEGGAFKCDNCQITLTDSEVRDNDAFNGGAIYSVNKITLTATRTVFFNNKAKNNGGVLAITNAAYTVLAPTVLTFTSCPSIDKNKADYGGFAYYDNNYAELRIIDSSVTNHTAYKRSAFIEAYEMNLFTISNSYIADFSAPLTTLMHSVARKLSMTISDSNIVCSNFYRDWDAYLLINTTTVPKNERHTNFYLEASKIVSLSKNNFKMCGGSLNGGVFWLTQGTTFNDYSSTFEYNSGANGGAINCQTCLMDLQLTFFQYNQAWRGGAVEIKEGGYMKSRRVRFDRNKAYYSAGGIYLNTFSSMDLSETEFTNNQAPENSAIEILESSKDKNITMDDCLFEKNIAVKNTICIRDANVAFNRSIIQKNSAKYLSKHLFIGFSNVYIESTQFKGVTQTNPRLASLTDETLGSHIYAILSSKVWIKETYFLDGISKLGGAMFIEGNSSIEMTKVFFQNNFARRKGGAIFANGFNLLKASGQSKFLNNLAIEDGDDFYISNTEGYFQLMSTTIENPKAASSIAAENVNVTLSNVVMQNIGVNPIRALTEGSGLSCYNCRALRIENSTFSNLNSLRGGALYIEESEDNKLSTDTYGKYLISGSKFDSCSAVAGGAIYMNNPQYFIIGQNTIFNNNKAKNSSSQTLKNVRGTGGAIYYDCDENSINCLLDIANTVFSNNYAEIKGGGVHWNTLEPLWGGITANGNMSSIKFTKNKAGRYGDNISAFAQQIVIIDEKDYKSSTFSSSSFVSNADSFGYSGGSRLLGEATPNSPDVLKNVSFSTEKVLDNQRSGGSIPRMYLGMVDKYGQIVSSDDESKINVMIDAFANNIGDNSKFPPFIEGSSQYEVRNGVVQIKDVSFAATPGYNYGLRFQSPDIRPDIVSAQQIVSKSKAAGNFTNQGVKSNVSGMLYSNYTETDLSVKINITLRECKAGEQFQWNGKCSECPTNTSFSLLQMNEPGDCQTCPSEKAVCYGGTNVGPAAGHWRSSNSSANFLECLHKPACLGMIPPLNNPMGQCAQGYGGIICADCQTGYSRSRQYQCSKCPHKGWIIFRILAISFIIVLLVLALLQSQLTTRYMHVYLRLLMNHIHLILLLASFNTDWPSKLQSFFDMSRPVTQPFSTLIDYECLKSSPSSGMRQIFSQVLFLGLLPVLMVGISYFAWKIHLYRVRQQNKSQVQNNCQEITVESEQNKKVVTVDDKQKQQDIQLEKEGQYNLSRKTIQTFTILMYIAYPNIMQFMFGLLKCEDIDGEMRLRMDLEVVCWSPYHKLFVYLIALPSLVVWTIGIPIFALIFLSQKRAEIISTNVTKTHETYGFLIGGFKAEFYFWEFIITMRKIFLTLLCIFVTNYSSLTQGLLSLLILMIFLLLTVRKRPYVNEALFDLEILSIGAAMITVYCGLLFINGSTDHESQGIQMSVNVRTFLLASVIGVNCIFFFYWIYRVVSEMEALRGFVMKTFPSLYLMCFACGDKDQAFSDEQKNKVLNQNECHKEELMKILKNVKDLYNRGDLLLNDEVMKKLRHYMKPEKVLQVAGIVDQNDEQLTKIIQQQLNQTNQADRENENSLFTLLTDNNYVSGSSQLILDTEHHQINQLKLRTDQHTSEHSKSAVTVEQNNQFSGASLIKSGSERAQEIWQVETERNRKQTSISQLRNSVIPHQNEKDDFQMKKIDGKASEKKLIDEDTDTFNETNIKNETQ